MNSSSSSTTTPKKKYSYGIILRCKERYLIVQNRDSEAFIYFFFAGISKWSDQAFRRLFSEFSWEETQRLLYMPFHDVYMDLYVHHDSTRHQQKYQRAKHNYNFLHSRPHLLHLLRTTFTRPIPWIFPKGRVEIGESEVQCAAREFREETGIDLPVTLLDPGKYIEYHQYKRFYRFDLYTKLFLVEIDHPIEIRYQRFDGVIRSLSVSDEIQYATWCHEQELRFYLFSSLYQSLVRFLHNNNNHHLPLTPISRSPDPQPVPSDRRDSRASTS